MFESEFMPYAELRGNLVDSLSMLCTEHREYVYLLLVFLLIYGVMVLPYQFRILFLKFENARLTRSQVSLKRSIASLECSDAIAMPEMIEKTVSNDCRDDSPYDCSKNRYYRDLWVDRHGGFPQVLRATLMALWASSIALVCCNEPSNLSFAVTCIGTGIVYAIMDGERSR
jgi:hypothetical protein